MVTIQSSDLLTLTSDSEYPPPHPWQGQGQQLGVLILRLSGMWMCSICPSPAGNCIHSVFSHPHPFLASVYHSTPKKAEAMGFFLGMTVQSKKVQTGLLSKVPSTQTKCGFCFGEHLRRRKQSGSAALSDPFPYTPSIPSLSPSSIH